VMVTTMHVMVTTVISAKMAEPIEIPFGVGLLTRTGPSNHVVDGGVII